MTDSEKIPEMGPQLCNALITNAPLPENAVILACRHFQALEAMLRISGPRFANARRDAVQMYDVARQRLQDMRRRAAATEQRQQVEGDTGFGPLEP